ncbi:hypothetical protein ACFLZK_01175 [Patescibacteria group bacterium]
MSSERIDGDYHILSEGVVTPVRLYLKKNCIKRPSRIRIDSVFPIHIYGADFEPLTEIGISNTSVLDLQFDAGNEPILKSLHPGLSQFKSNCGICNCRILKDGPHTQKKFTVIVMEKGKLKRKNFKPKDIIKVKKERFKHICICEDKCICESE